MDSLNYKDASATAPFYRPDGLCFQCQRCSGCCRFSPGFVFLSREDITALLTGTGLPFKEFQDRYLRVVNIGRFARVSLREKENYDCIFWENGGCGVYPHRPLQCRSFPFWSSLLLSPAAWLNHKNFCPGIGEGRLHPAAEIDDWLNQRLAERLIEVDQQNGGDFWSAPDRE